MSTDLDSRVLTDEQPILRSTDASAAVGETPISLFVYLVIGTLFGIILTKSEAVSWFRIQEMFRFQSFHMYGIIGGAFVVAALSLQWLRRSGRRSVRGDAIDLLPKERTPGLKRYWMGGAVFGLGWGLLGACPGPIFALIGAGVTVIFVPLAAGLAGTWAYAAVRTRLPH